MIPRSVAICKKYNIRISHEARQVKPQDFRTFTYILASDSMNLANLERIKPTDSTAIVKLWGVYDDGKPIEDPYYGGVVSCSTNFYSSVALMDKLGRV